MASNSDQARPGPGIMRRGWVTQRRAIGALIMRELHTRYGRENIGYLWVILEPLLLASMIGLIHTRSANHFSNDIKPVPLALLGYCNFIVFRSIVGRAEGAIENASSLLYHRTVSIIDIMISRAMLEIAGAWIAFILLMSLSIAVGVSTMPERPLWVLFGMFLMAILSFNIGMIVSAATHENKALGRLVHPMTYIMMPLSGAFFPMDILPKVFRDIVLYIPLAPIFELLRFGFFKSCDAKYTEPLYVTGWILGSMLIGFVWIAVSRKHIHMD